MSSQVSLLRIYLSASEHWHGAPLYRAVVERALALRLAGASVFNVELGLGPHHQIHDVFSEYTSYDVPVVIEIVDAPDRAAMLADVLGDMLGDGLVVTSAAVLRDATASDALSRSTYPRARDAGTMKTESEAKRVTIYIGSSDVCDGRNLAVAIVERCRAMGLAGATVYRGVMGFGKHSVIHRAHLLTLSDDLPEKVEIVDRSDEIDRLLLVLDEMIGDRVVMVEDVHVVRFAHGSGGSADVDSR